jgi:hypothetical protein
MTNPNAEQSRYIRPAIRGILGGVLLFALQGSAISEQEQPTNPVIAAPIDTYDFPEKSMLEVAESNAREATTSRSATITVPDVYCWDGENKFTIADAADKKHRNIGSTCLLATKESWYKNDAKEQVRCLVKLWTKESQFDHTAENSTSGAFGIPQAMPGNKMKSAGKDWQTNPTTQIAWGLEYIKGRYGSPCEAWDHSVRKNWY